MFEPNDEPNFVDVNTDDLDAFTDLFVGKAQIKDDTPENDQPLEDALDDTNEEVLTSEEQEDVPDDKEDKEPPKKVNKVQERINKALEKQRLATERAEAAERRLAELEKQRETAPTASTQPVNDGPTPEDKNDDGSDKYPLGEFDPQYIRDLTRHTIQKEQEAARQEQLKNDAIKSEQEARQQLDTQWRSKLDTVTQQHEDFLEKTVELEETFEGLDPQYADYLVQTIKSLDHGPEVLYYFANNLAEAQKFVTMGPLAATLALGEYNAMFKGQTRKEARVSAAPPPPQVNKGTSTRKAVAGDTDDLELFEKEFFAKRK